MECKIKTVLVIYKSEHDQARGMAWSVADWLVARGLTVLVRENSPEALPVAVPAGTVWGGVPARQIRSIRE